ncbi:MAG: hypothetical protein AAF485_26045 [Chloroflexota bacterium]
MPACQTCGGSGRRAIKKEVKTHCPECHGTKELPDGTTCKTCDDWGEVGTGQFKKTEQLCKTCLGSGQVSQGNVNFWFALWAVPISLILLGGGGFASWLVWDSFDSGPIAAIVAITCLTIWGVVMYYLINTLPE